MLYCLLLWACADDWQHADIQLDLSQANWQRESRLRACIHGQQNHESALQAGRVAVDFLSLPMALTVQLFPPQGEGDEPSHALSQSIDSIGYHSAEWETCDSIQCIPCQAEVSTEQGTELLAIRLNPDERIP